MSTRASLWYTEEIHIYQELLEGDAVYIELERNGVLVNFKLMTMDEWRKLTKTTIRAVDDHVHKWAKSTDTRVMAVCEVCGLRKMMDQQ
jgi:hypothetical protein